MIINDVVNNNRSITRPMFQVHCPIYRTVRHPGPGSGVFTDGLIRVSSDVTGTLPVMTVVSTMAF